MPYEIFFDLETKYGEGVLLEEYNEEYSLIAASKGQGQGTIFKKWVFPQMKDRKPAEKALPWKVTLGGHRQAIKALEYFLKHLKGED